LKSGPPGVDDNGGISPDIADASYLIDYLFADSGAVLGFSLDKRQ